LSHIPVGIDPSRRRFTVVKRRGLAARQHDHHETSATEPATKWINDCERAARRYGGVDCIAATPQYLNSRL
jgi:hypothetical protein